MHTIGIGPWAHVFHPTIANRTLVRAFWDENNPFTRKFLDTIGAVLNPQLVDRLLPRSMGLFDGPLLEMFAPFELIVDIILVPSPAVLSRGSSTTVVLPPENW